MRLRQRLAADLETARRLEGRSRWRFVWDYYRVPIVILAAAVLLGALTVSTSARHAKCALYAVFVNAAPAADGTHDPEPLEALLEEGGIDMKGKRVDLTADLYLGADFDAGDDGRTIQVLAALFGISDLDFFAADPGSFGRYAVLDAFADLSVLIEPEFWQDRPEADLIWHENDEGRRALEGIVLHAGSPLHEAGYFLGDVAVGAAANGENLDAAVALIRALLRAS